MTTLQNVLDFDITPVISRYCRVYNIDIETAKKHEIELKKYLFLCSIRKEAGFGYGIRGNIDELWHTFIIFTKLYKIFCTSTLGKFIHHSPTEAKQSSPFESEEKYWQTITAYRHYFNSDPPYDVWIRPKPLKDISLLNKEDSSGSSSSGTVDSANDGDTCDGCDDD